MSILSKLKRKLRRIIGRREVFFPTCDKIIYEDLPTSYSGGSLSNSRVMWVTNNAKFVDGIRIANELENIWDAPIINENILDVSLEKILDTEKTNIGPFEHIINVLRLNKSDDSIYSVFNLIQKEVDYLQNITGITTISTIIYFADDMEVEQDTLSKFIFGIARNILLAKKIICNAVFTSSLVPVKEAINAGLFMSGKYAYGLSGEVLILKP